MRGLKITLKRNQIRLESILSNMRGLKSAQKERAGIRPESALSNGRGPENALERKEIGPKGTFNG
jgi:hypothetical protein